MSRTIAQISADFDSLTVADFDEGNPKADGFDRVSALCDELTTDGEVVAWAPVLFRTMERLDGAYLGSPGPMVHLLERRRGSYEQFLAESLDRKPTATTVWMVNRILNGKPPGREAWLDRLRSAADHPAASEQARSEAQRFLKFQMKC